MGAPVARSVSSFRLFRTNVRQAFERFQSPDMHLDVLLTWATTRFAAVSVRHEPRLEGKSNYTFGRLVHHALNMITGFSQRPLRIASMIGFVFTIFGGVVIIAVVARYLIAGDSVPGFPFLASIVAIFSGVQLLILGIMGEYLARMHVRLMERPTYVVVETTEDEHRRP
jgi:undecaprenyl-phosphate 4-deoxy-4-formamido-L-arabinose transferase